MGMGLLDMLSSPDACWTVHQEQSVLFLVVFGACNKVNAWLLFHLP